MASISSISSRLTLNTDKFRNGMQRASKRVKKFSTTVTEAGTKFAKWGAVLGGGALLVGLGAVTKAQMEAIDTTNDLAQQLGITTLALSRLDYAAQLNGSSADQMNQGLEVMSKRLGEVAYKGSGAAKQALDTLGLSAKALISMNPADAFKAIAQAMSRVQSQSEKNAITASIFSRANQGLVNVLALGADGLNKYAKAADKLGYSFTNIDAQKIGNTGDAIDKLKSAFKGLGNQIAIGLAPAITNLSKILTVGVGLIKSLTSATGGAAAKILAWTAALTAAVLLTGAVVGAIKKIIAAYKDLAESLVIIRSLAGPKGWAILAVSAGIAAAAAYGVDKAFDAINSSAPQVAQNTTKIANSLGNVATNARIAGQQVNNLALYWQLREKDAKDRADSITSIYESLNKQAAFAGMGERQKLIAQLQSLSASPQGIAFALGRYDTAQARDKTLKLSNALAGIQTQFDQLGMSQIDIKINGLGQLGATNAQLTVTRMELERIKQLQTRNQHQNTIKGMIQAIQRRVKTFGMNDKQKAIFKLKNLGATKEQIAKLSAAYDKLNRLKAGNAASGRASLVLAGSAKSQMLQYTGGHGNQAIPRQQLTTQKKMARSLDTIAKNTRTGSEQTVDRQIQFRSATPGN